MARVVDPKAVEARERTVYPKEHAGIVKGRQKRVLTEILGLTQFGVNMTTLQPGAASGHRHWHVTEDEFCYVLEGEITLVTDNGEQVLGPGMAIGYPANDENGHHLVNRTKTPATYLEIGTRAQIDRCFYPDVDMDLQKVAGKYSVRHKDGRPYE